MSLERVPVMQHGSRIGTLPAVATPEVGTLRVRCVPVISGVKEMLDPGRNRNLAGPIRPFSRFEERGGR